MHSIIVITGQTGTGKTRYALNLAKERGGELVSADSRQIYKQLDIITGKDIPSGSRFEETIDETPHNPHSIGFYLFDEIRVWLYDAVDPKDYCSSFDYVGLASQVIDDIIARKKIPIIVGGTYLYLKHLLYGVDTENIPPNWPLRREIENLSITQLQEKLNALDPSIFNKLNLSDRQNPRRLIRKIEIAMLINSVPTDRQTRDGKEIELKYPLDEFIGFRFKSINNLTQTIIQRVDARLEKGALKEVGDLIDKGYTENDPGMNTIGYKQLIKVLQKDLTLEEARKDWIQKEIDYAKRQYVFMKKDTNISWRKI